MELKVCSKCKVEKPESEFRLKRFGKDGIARFRCDCRKCENVRSPKAMEARRARDRARMRREDVKAKRALVEKTPERIAWRKAYHEARRVYGKVCFFMVCKCEKCSTVKGLRKKPLGDLHYLCGRCSLLNRKKEVVCRDCGIVHISSNHGARCEACVRLYEKADKKRRKALERGARRGEIVITNKVFALDSWRCRLCKCKVQKRNIYANNAAELDHIVPISKGGTHTYDNVQTLCRRCNGKKSNNIVPVQLRLGIM